MRTALELSVVGFLGFFLPFPLALAVYILSLSTLYFRRHSFRVRNEFRWAMGVLIVFFIIRSLAFIFFFLDLKNASKVPFSYKLSPMETGFFLLPTLGDVTLQEHSVAYRWHLINGDIRRARTYLYNINYQIDPFSGSFYRVNEHGVEYSIGPDLIDDFGRIVYDPSNGTFSLGDIFRRSTTSMSSER